MRHAVLLIVTALGVFPDAARAQDPVPVSAEWVGKWRADLDTAASQLADYATQNDPVLDAVLSFRPRPGQAAGRWSGVLGIRGRNFDIAVEITETSAGWSGVLSIPALEVERATLRDVVVQGDEVRFTWVTPRDSIDFVARAGAQRLIGFGFYTGFFYPVALERAEGREDREQ